MSKLEAFPFAHTEQAYVNRKEHLYPYLKRTVAVGTAALAAVCGVQLFEAATTEKPLDETTVTVQNGDTAIGAVERGNEIIADQHHYDPNAVSGVVDEGQKIGSYVIPGQQIEIHVTENGFGQKSIHADEPTNIPRQ